MRTRTISLLTAVAISVASLGTAAPAQAQVDESLGSIAIPYVLSDTPLDEGTTAVRAVKEYGPCTLWLDYIHLRKSGNWGTIGFKPHTKCSVPVTSIKHSSDLRYKYYTAWRLALSGVRDSAYNTNRLDQNNIAFTCNGKVDTRFIGVTLGTIVYRGKTYYARSYSEVANLPCRV
ncbi:hypothetical protein HMPREF2651_03660 [Corynebacterium sp. HMSC063A05]|nr:hypothetical protein DR71_1671 [Corynebacterium sp. ATCC 6931]KAA9288265.1 hypothetical protein F6I11_06500 [Corynebacterium amycolatum]MBC6758541.1 hypothetical protein [Corynebacterium sp. LK24]OFM86366.1 hypothetical protein HMPREF2651_03660 [Corynebacterium sp. HMSC063A05]OFN06555.1 hypothetical protein HMPREF2614_10465 [Corynebacterium sp. HMSC074C11]OFR92071.1 hypothetical protein HMPREF2860_05185 [Corynebacterium sp. HMSC064E10]OFU56325.1 hypothetical protein HMPREF3122_03735 [Coryn